MNSKIIFIAIIVSVIFSINTFSQTAPNRYWLQFKDKNNSPYSINNPSDFLSERAIKRRNNQNIQISEDDIPITPMYIDSLKKLGIKIVNKSKWFNAVTIKTTDIALLDTLTKLSFVKIVLRNNVKVKNFEVPEKENNNSTNSYKGSTNIYDYGAGLNQIEMLNGQILHNYGYQGQGMLIAVLDAGFYRVDSLPAFDSIRANNNIVATKDFIDGDNNVFDAPSHGMMVLSTIGGYVPGSLIGTAPRAKFLLLRSEDSNSENIIEEDNWVSAAEYADSAGADIISSSLGYTTFDDPSQSHTYSDMNGKTTRVSIAATIAARKGIIVVNSAGNSGGNSWHYIGAPADADSILTVGAVDQNGDYIYFSSTGPTFDKRIKPDIVAKGYLTAVETVSGNVSTGNGTSFAAPVVAGLVACLWQANPNSTNMEIIDAIKRSANKYSHPDSLRGYGIPNFAYANSILHGINYDDFSNENLLSIYPNPFSSNFNVRFYSVDSQDIKIEIFNLVGEKIFNNSFKCNAYSINDINIISSNNISQGIYFLKISSNSKVYQQKLIKN